MPAPVRSRPAFTKYGDLRPDFSVKSPKSTASCRASSSTKSRSKGRRSTPLFRRPLVSAREALTGQVAVPALGHEPVVPDPDPPEGRERVDRLPVEAAGVPSLPPRTQEHGDEVEAGLHGEQVARLDRARV